MLLERKFYVEIIAVACCMVKLLHFGGSGVDFRLVETYSSGKLGIVFKDVSFT